MFYRRKLILGLLKKFDGELEKIAFQKLLFLFSNKQSVPTFNFVPYLYGCYSFSATYDIQGLALKNFVSESDNSWKLTTKETPAILQQDEQDLNWLTKSYSGWSSKKLIDFTYKHFPYYSQKSILLKHKPQLEKDKSETVFTIGYEGKSVEAYFNLLINSGVHCLVDVRKNPLSMKWGFSKKNLQSTCAKLGLDYVHIPDLGIKSEQRKDLKTQLDYDKLFESYNKRIVFETSGIQQLSETINSKKKIALTCFEANTCQCHRTHLVNFVNKKNGVEVCHL